MKVMFKGGEWKDANPADLLKMGAEKAIAYNKTMQEKIFRGDMGRMINCCSTDELFKIINLVRKGEFFKADMILLKAQRRWLVESTKGTYYSNCCNAKMDYESDRCPECKEGCDKYKEE